jgi:hypothetical protein
MRNKFGYLGNTDNDGLSFDDPGITKVRFCGVCGTECLVERDVNGPTSFAAAWAGHKCLHDVFRCPHYGSEWHDIATKLIHEMVATASKRLRAMIEMDLDDLLLDNLPPDRPIQCGNCCSKCGQRFDICSQQTCPNCGSVECAAYKPWMRGCNSTDSCAHRLACEWARKP